MKAMRAWSVLWMTSALAAASAKGASAAESFAHPELLVDTVWVAEHLSDDGVRLVDARSAEDYAQGHIPGAVSLPRSSTFAPEGPRGLVGSASFIAELAGARGIDETVHVVVYDEGRSNAAARVFWTLEYYGHPRVSVLDGGFGKWRAESRPVSTEVPVVTPVRFAPRAVETLRATKDEIRTELGASETVMLDVRSEGEYTGESVRAERSGHIPGAVHIEWTRNFTSGETPILKSPAELSRLYEEAGITRDKRVHAY